LKLDLRKLQVAARKLKVGFAKLMVESVNIERYALNAAQRSLFKHYWRY